MESKRLQFEDKKKYVRGVFDRIAPHYDKMNLFMSWGLLKKWQRVVLDEVVLPEAAKVLDVCTGTGELAALLAEKVGPGGEVIGLDMSETMLGIAQKKACRQEKRCKTKARISFIAGDALQLPFAADSFDCVTMGFALRNVTDINRAVSEMYRVCKTGGQVICLEISEPTNVLWRAGFRLYFYRLIPLFGRLIDRRCRISGKIPAYTWLAESLKGFPQREEMRQIFEEAGLADVCYNPLHGGIVTIYRGGRS